MAGSNTGLGKGLDALIRETSTDKARTGMQVVPIMDVVPNANQPRRKFTEKTLEELAASIKSQGLLQPILVRPLGEQHPGKYEIVAGERRWRACQLAGMTEVPVIIRTLSAQETLAAALIENLQREDLNPVEEALGIQTLKEEFELSQEDLAKKLGKSRSSIANSLRLLSLPEGFRKDLMDGKLTAGHGRALLGITEERAQEYLRNLVLEENLSVRETEALAAIWKETGQFKPEGALFTRDLTSEAPGANGGSDARQEEPGSTSQSGPSGEARKNRPQSARMLDIQTNLGALFSVPVRVTGGENKGRISLTYTSREELDTILNKLALAAGDSAGRAALEGAARVELLGSEAAALERRQSSALPHQNKLALEESAQAEEAIALPGQGSGPAIPMAEGADGGEAS